MAVGSMTGGEFYFVEVVAIILKCLKDCLLVRLDSLGAEVNPADIHWTITVPAIWKPEGKQLMREAAGSVRKFFK